MLKPVNQTPSPAIQKLHEPLLDRSLEQSSTSGSASKADRPRLGSPSDAPVSQAALSHPKRGIPSVTPNAKHLAYLGLAREIVSVSGLIQTETPTKVQIQSISAPAQGILDLWKENNPQGGPDLGEVGEGKSINLGKLLDAVQKAGLPSYREIPEDSHNREGKEIAGLKRRGIDVEIVAPDEEHNLVKKNPVGIYFGDRFHDASQKVAEFESNLFKNIFSVPTTTIDQVKDRNINNHYDWIATESMNLANALSRKREDVDGFAVETKLRTLFNYNPTLAPILEKALIDKTLAALLSPLVASPPIDMALTTIDSLYQELNSLLEAKYKGDTNDAEIGQALEQKVKDLHASGNLLGRVSSKIKENPGNSNELQDYRLAKWMAKGKEPEFTQPVIYGVINSGQTRLDSPKQSLLDNLVRAMGVDTAKYNPDIPVVIRMQGKSEEFEENVVNPFRERLIVNTKIRVAKPGESSEKLREIDLKQAPLIQTLENIISGRYDLVHQDLLEILDNADIFEVSSSRDPKFALELQEKFHNPSDDIAKSLKRTMTARLLIPALSLEGTSVSETAGNLAGPTLIGMAMDVGKNFIPDNLGALKTILMQAFFLGVDAADNLAGAWPEVQSLLETLGVEKVDYESVFGEPAPEGAAAKAKEFVKLALGLRGADGEAGPAVATGLRSAVIGTVIGNVLSAGYTLAIGVLDLNPALRAAIGIPAIVGTSLGIAINFAVNHADLSLAYKQQIHEGLLGVPDTVDKSSPAELNAYSSHLAKKQLMTLSGTGPAAKAFTYAPLAALSNLLGYVIPMKVVEAVITPLMPGMENLVRLGAMVKHESAMKQTLERLDERVIGSAAEGKSPTVNGEEFEKMMYGRMDNLTADITLMVGGLLTGLLGRNGYHDFQIVSGGNNEAIVDEVVLNAQTAAQNLQDMDVARRTA